MAAELTSRLGHHFAATGHFIYPQQNNQGWPLAPNFAFQSICHYVRTIIAPTEGWMMMEMDCVPLQHGWMDALQSEYYADYNRPIQKFPTHRAFMGAKTRTYATRNGEVLGADVSGYHMAMSGVYPARAIDWLTSLPGVVSTSRPFYEFLQWQVAKSFHDTQLIQNNWKTKNYQIKDGQIACEDDANWAWDAKYNDPVRNNSVLLHGCRDGSLVDVLEKARPAYQKIPVSARPQPTLSPRPAVPTNIPSFGQQQPIEVSSPRNAGLIPIEQRQTPIAPVAALTSPTAPMPLILFGNSSRGRIEDAGLKPEILPETTATSFQDKLERQIWEQNQAKALTPTVQPIIATQQVVQHSVKTIQEKRKEKQAIKRKSSWTPERKAHQAEVMRKIQAARRLLNNKPSEAVAV